jgi:folate-binding protein YgfZ
VGRVLAVFVDRDVVRVSGPDAESYLQGQLSQDVVGLAAGEAAWSLLLQPQGKVDAFLRVTRVAGDDFLLDTDAGWGGRVVERLERFKLRTKADVEALDWKCLALRGDGGGERPQGDVVLPFEWGSLTGFDVLGPNPTLPAGAEVADPAEYERLRIEAGVPVMGKELDERTIPAEAGVVDRAVSFTKGCYTGQELVARIDSRGGNVPKHLRLIRVEGTVPPAGATVRHDGKDVGTLTSVAAAEGTSGAVALGYVGRAVGVPATVDVAWDGGGATGRVEDVP